MNDRFKFRVYFKGSEYAKAGYVDLTRNDVIFSLRTDGQIIRNVVYECQQEGHEGSPCNMPFEPNNDLYDIQFCTGLKDKNGKLIYEGDIVKQDGDNFEIKYCEKCKSYQCFGKVSWVKEKYCYACEGDYIWCEFIEGLDKAEVIGNIYENEDLLKCENQ